MTILVVCRSNKGSDFLGKGETDFSISFAFMDSFAVEESCGFEDSWMFDIVDQLGRLPSAISCSHCSIKGQSIAQVPKSERW